MRKTFSILVIISTILIVAFLQIQPEFRQSILSRLGRTIVIASLVGLFLAIPFVLILKKFDKDKIKATSDPDFRSELKIALNDAISAVETGDAEKVEEAIHKILNTLSKYNFSMERLMN